MMSVSMKEIYKLAAEYDKTILADDPRLRGLVVVQSMHEYGHFVFDRAFVMGYQEYYLVFAEHHDFQIYHMDDYSVVHFKNREYNIEQFDPKDTPKRMKKVHARAKKEGWLKSLEKKNGKKEKESRTTE